MTDIVSGIAVVGVALLVGTNHDWRMAGDVVVRLPGI
jgi:type IV secretory pathway VirB2 component (pilin)